MWLYACHVTLLWSYFGDYHMRLRIVCLSIRSLPTLCLKDPQMVNDTIHPELLTVRVVRWSKLPGSQQLKNKKNRLLTINNYLLKHNGVTIIYTIYIYIERNYHLIFQAVYIFSTSHPSTRNRKRMCIPKRDMLATSQSHPTPVAAREVFCGPQLNSNVNFSTDY